MSEFSNVLDLSDADTTGVEPLDAAKYNAEIWEVTWEKTKSDSTGAYGPDWPYINVQFRVLDGKVNGQPAGDNRRVFLKLFPTQPQGYDAEKARRAKGGFVNFLTAIGYKEDEVKKADFQLPDFEGLKGRPCVITVSKNTEYNNNNVTGVKPKGTSTDAATATGLL